MPKNMLSEAQNRFYYSHQCEQMVLIAWDSEQPRGLAEMRRLIFEAFTAGANWNMRTTSVLSPHIAKFIEMLILLGICDDAQVIRETESGSPLWHSTGGDGARVGATGNQIEPPY
jgi:hypothetical protein